MVAKTWHLRRLFKSNLDRPELPEDRDSVVEGSWTEAIDSVSGKVNLRIYVEMGMYGTQVKRYVECFGRNAVHIMILEEVLLDPVGEMQRLWKFLDVSEDVRGAYATALPISNESTRRSRIYINRMPYKQQIKAILPKRLRSVVKEALSGFGGKPMLKSTDVPDELMKIYRQESLKLARVMGRSRCPWSL